MEACGIPALTEVIAERYPTRRSGSHWHITQRTTSATMNCRSPHLPSTSVTQNSSVAVRQIQRGKPQGYTVNSFHAGCCFCGQSAQHQLEAVMWVTGGVEGSGWGGVGVGVGFSDRRRAPAHSSKTCQKLMTFQSSPRCLTSTATTMARRASALSVLSRSIATLLEKNVPSYK